MIISISLVILLLFSPVDEKRPEPTLWKKVHIKEGIVVSERWISLPNGDKTRERKGEFIIKSQADDLIILLSDASQVKKWMRAVDVHQVFGAKHQNEWYAYTIYDIPWPFKSQGLISHYHYHELPKKLGFVLNITSVGKSIPTGIVASLPNDRNLKSLNNYQAEWVIKKLATGHSSVCFTASSTDPPPFPRWIMDPVLIKVLTRPYKKLLGVDADPHKVAGGFALGSFIGMTPFVGMQILISVSIASLAKWNRIAAGLGVFNTNLATGLFVFSFNYYIGSKILGLSSDFQLPDKLNLSFIPKILEAGFDVFLSLLIGGFITGLPFAFLVYHLTYRILKRKQLRQI